MQTKEQLQQIVLQLKARKLELNEEQTIIDRELYRYLGKMERLFEEEKEAPQPQ